MLAGALCRLAADVPRASPHDMPQLARHLGRALLARNIAESSTAGAFSRAFAYALYSRRSYATTTRATEPTATVKKAVKTASKTPPKKTASATKTTAKKPAAKKAKKKATKKPAAKKPAKKRVKKVLTEEEKEKVKIRELRAKALKEPVSPRGVTAYNVFIAEYSSGKGEGMHQNARITEATKEFKNLTPAQLEHYNHIANEKTAARKAEFDKWLKSHTPQQIRIANIARAQLRKKLAGTQKCTPAHTAKLHDDRHVKTSVRPYIAFTRARHASGDMKGISVPQAAKLIAKEWKKLSESERMEYKSDAQASQQ
jgi:hypothetical protein